MQDARYLRDQAKLCLEIARQMSDRQVAESLRMDAAQYFARATAVESGQAPEAPRSAERH